MTYILIDFEATCSDRNAVGGEIVPRHEMEIIEIGAVALETSLPFQTLDEFQCFIRPVRHPRLTAFCTSLTSIEQHHVDAGESFEVAVAGLKQWFWSFEDPIFCSWGDYDRKQLDQDCRFHGVPFPLSSRHINIKKRFSAVQRLPKTYGMAGALRRAGLRLQGTHHRGIDDVRNMARLAPYIFGNQELSSCR